MIEQKSSLITDEEISEKLEIYISGRNITYSNSAPSSYIMVELAEFGKNMNQVLHTKICPFQKNPNYSQTLIIDFIFEVKQKLIFNVFQEGGKLLGKMETSVGEIFGSPSNGLIRSIKDQKNQQNGKLILRCQKVQKGKRRTFNAQITANNLPNLRWWFFFGGTCPFFRIFRIRQTDELLLYESETINYSINPEWKPFKLSEQKLCKLTESMELEIRVYNFSASGNHTLIGITQFSLNKLGIRKNFQILSNKQSKGEIIFKEVKRTIKHEFGNFIQKGLQLALTTCIDFTASNGNPESQTSLHFGTLTRKSQYEEAISQVLNILLDYDYDKLVPCYGFGAQVNHPKFTTRGKVHHCFPMNGNQNNPCIYQKNEIIKTYRTIFPYLKFSGPTKFSQLLKQSIETCKDFQKNHEKTQYMILFILTDGQIHDRAEVFDLLIQCNRLPMSIIIVGVGDGDFTIMHQLDDDDCQMMDSNGNKTERDLVQFVEFKKFKNNGIELAKEVLYQLPRQVEEYFELVGIEPSEMIQKMGDIEEQILLDISEMER